MKFRIPCIHETKGISKQEIVADYHPLTLEEIITLINLAHAYKKEDPKIVDDIQKRLAQGIMGMTCPKPEEGEIGKRISVIKILFYDAMRNDIHPISSMLLALQLFTIMTLETDVDTVGPIFAKADMLTRSIDDLELTVRAHTCLEKLDIKTIGELTQKTEAELFSMRYTGPKSINEIKSALNALGLSFAERKYK